MAIIVSDQVTLLRSAATLALYIVVYSLAGRDIQVYCTFCSTMALFLLGFLSVFSAQGSLGGKSFGLSWREVFLVILTKGIFKHRLFHLRCWMC